MKTGKKFLLPLSLMILSMGMMMIKEVKPGNIEAYTALNLSFYVLALLPIVRLSLPEMKRQQHQDRIFSEAVHSDTASGSHIEEVLTEVKPPFVIPKDLALGYRLEVENFIASRAYLDADLNKNNFCERINIPQGHVSPFLKQAYDKSFNGFINELRLAYATKELNRKEFVYTIDDLSFICGFRSRASFYRNFTAAFGCSPHQYRVTKLETTP
ncbi:helix-turn-helix domain-containing protein [Sphingobacterium sp. FBM7-1]|uniref:helix-turn-helix domain-containing protein n=1 Tax=Sphingobacterium sp. FBM7-1 TaxID=2886688 RepID=UPI001D11DE39|nr:helix-turn-helix domain-containing protein [Sphingobacterium sp. FBM7-1]MCC2597858.1 helix-turn-helix domain-containing protein [Sphingobacterium sp. FBM7-1]